MKGTGRCTLWNVDARAFLALIAFTVIVPLSHAASLSKEGLARVQREIESNWLHPFDLVGSQPITITAKIHLNRKGAIEGTPEIAGSGAPASELKSAILSIRRALNRSAPFQLQEEEYDNWKVITLTFQLSTEP
ncbi:TonB C-terminal domain-containing protein [Phyllobacterium sp. A18/5-2]|jgi:hypothetical protein|uniref:TonB C-terminal domain-containing protein n=1 Tax=Phyllobacterium sp. A18/5-2 TaxID=2978392 RepID=UPI0021C975E3|nr:TonB C-terminal domain-containing protein [Phyllobacterium sp. A18/5-2]UXN65267.1 TonB C-terminal domain-containing protein [Phyllobacterium sp. A18/5-2]